MSTTLTENEPNLLPQLSNRFPRILLMIKGSVVEEKLSITFLISLIRFSLKQRRIKFENNSAFNKRRQSCVVGTLNVLNIQEELYRL